MKPFQSLQSLLPYDIALKIASSLQVEDVCALGSCSRFWRELCESDYIWESLVRERWPFLDFFQGSTSSATDRKTQERDQDMHSISEGWRSFYTRRHNEMSVRTTAVVEFIERRSLLKSLEVGDYLKAIEELQKFGVGFVDVQLFLFQPKLNVLLNLLGLHYCIDWLQVPAEYVTKALENSNISDRHVCVKWWKLGRWFYGFRLRDESHSRWVSLADLTAKKEENMEVLSVLHRGAVHEVMRIQISTSDPYSPPWSCQSTERLGQ